MGLLPGVLGFILVLPVETNPAWPVRWPIHLLVEASRGQTGPLSRAVLPLLLATVLMLALGVAMALSALSRILTHLQPTHSHARVPSRRPPAQPGRSHLWLLTLTARRLNLLLLWLFSLIPFFLLLHLQPQIGGSQDPWPVALLYTGSVSVIGLGVFLPEGMAAALPYLWPMPLGRFWRERALWLLGQGMVLTAIYTILFAPAGAPLPVPTLLLALSLSPGVVVWGSYLAVRFRFFGRKMDTIPASLLAIPLGFLTMAGAAAFLEVLFHAFWPLLLAVNGALLVTPFLVVPALLDKPGPHHHPI